MTEQKQQKTLNIKIHDDDLKGRYSNLLRVTHTREEFILDFINVVPPQAVLTSRLIASPGHLKRIVRALAENLEIYEKNFGPLTEAPDPSDPSSVN